MKKIMFIFGLTLLLLAASTILIEYNKVGDFQCSSNFDADYGNVNVYTYFQYAGYDELVGPQIQCVGETTYIAYHPIDIGVLTASIGLLFVFLGKKRNEPAKLE